MRTPVLLVSLAGCLSFSCPALAQSGPTSPPFVENAGQWPVPVHFRIVHGTAAAWLVDGGLVIGFERFDPAVSMSGMPMRGPSRGGVAIEMAFEGSRSRPRGVGATESGHRFVRAVDGVAATFVAEARCSVVYDALYPGVALAVRAAADLVAYDLHLSAAASLDDVRIRCEGVDDLRIDAEGRLVLDNAVDALVQSRPIAWYELPDGGREAAGCEFKLLGERRFGFALTAPRRALPLVVDPGISWVSSTGGSQRDWLHHAVRDPATGAIYAVGEVFSPDFPTTVGLGFAGNSEVGLVKTSATGQRQWSVVMMGSQLDYGSAVAVGPSGEVGVAGLTRSTNFPLTSGAFDTTMVGACDGFCALFDAAGALQLSTYVGGSNVDFANCVAFDAAGQVFVGGSSFSVDLPVTPGVLQPQRAGNYDMFVMKLDPQQTGAGQQVLGTYLGGSGQEGYVTDLFTNTYDPDAMALLVGDQGEIIVAGLTQSTNFPTTPSGFQQNFTGGSFSDVGIAILDAAATRLLYGTYIGGLHQDYVNGLARHPGGGFVYVGSTFDSSYPATPGAFQQQVAGRNDGVIAWIDPSLPGRAGLRYATMLGGGPPGTTVSAADGLQAVHVDPSGIVTTVGFSYSAGFPTTVGAFATGLPGASASAVISRLVLHGRGADDLLYSSFVGAGQVGSYGGGLGVGTRGEATLALTSDDPVLTGTGQVAFVTLEMDLLPTGIARVGTSSTACVVPLVAGVRQAPQRGSPGFGLTFSAAPPLSSGAVLVGSGLTQPWPVLGADILVSPWVSVGAASDGLGFATFGLPVPATVQVGAQLSVQAVFLTNAACPGSGLIASSDRIDVTVF